MKIMRVVLINYISILSSFKIVSYTKFYFIILYILSKLLMYWEYLHHTALVSITFLLFPECFFSYDSLHEMISHCFFWKLILWKDFRYFRYIYPIIIYMINSVRIYISSLYSLDEGPELFNTVSSVLWNIIWHM